MKIDILNIDGSKESIEILDKMLSTKINKNFISKVLYKTISNIKGRKAKTKQKMKSKDQQQKFMLKKELVTQDTQAEKHQSL